MIERGIQIVTIPPDKINLRFAGYSIEEEKYAVAAIKTATSYRQKGEDPTEKQKEYLERIVKEVNRQISNFYEKKPSEEFGFYLDSKASDPEPNEIN